MLISYHARSPYENLVLAEDGLYRGTPLEIVLAMKHTSIFDVSVAVTYYLRFQVERLGLEAGIVRPDAPPAQQASASLEALIGRRNVLVLSDNPAEGGA